MKLEQFPISIQDYQDELYNWADGRLGLAAVSILDAVIEMVKLPVRTIGCLALIALNLIGALFSKDWSIKDAVICTEDMLHSITSIPAAVIMLPSKLLYQLYTIAINPHKTESIGYLWRKYRYEHLIED